MLKYLKQGRADVICVGFDNPFPHVSERTPLDPTVLTKGNG